MSRRLAISSLLCNDDGPPIEPPDVTERPVIRSPVSHMRSLSPYQERRPRAFPDVETDTSLYAHGDYSQSDGDFAPDADGEDAPPSSGESYASDAAQDAVRMPSIPVPARAPSKPAPAESSDWEDTRVGHLPNHNRDLDGPFPDPPSRAPLLPRSAAAALSPATPAHPFPHRSPGLSAPSTLTSLPSHSGVFASPTATQSVAIPRTDAYSHPYSPVAYVGPPARMLSGPGVPPPLSLSARSLSSSADAPGAGSSPLIPAYVPTTTPPRSAHPATTSPTQGTSHGSSTSPKQSSPLSGLDVLMQAASVHEERERRRRSSGADVLPPSFTRAPEQRSPMATVAALEDNAEEWLLEQATDQHSRRALSPTLSMIPPASALQGPGSAPPRPLTQLASTSTTTSRATKASKGKKKGRADAQAAADVDDELLSLVGDAPPSKRMLVGPGQEVDLPLGAASSPAAGGSERGSMPPPPGPLVEHADGGSKKKAAGKSKQPVKSRAKAPTKSKAKATAPIATTTPASDIIPVTSSGRTKKAPARFADAAIPAIAASTSRSRSTSAMPTGAGATTEAPKLDAPEPEDMLDEEEDDRLYCLCQQRWDENSVMIGCDICEGWYHPRCVKMPEHWIDLVDQYVCPNCTNMADSKRTTWKQRCKYGLEQPDPSLPSVCHKPVRAEGSKYCSDECGVRHMKARIDAWTAQGGRCDQLWESVKLAPKPEGVVVLAPDAPVASVTPMPVEPATKGKPLSVEYQPEPLLPAAAPPESRLAREAARLRAQIDGWAAQRAALRTELAHVAWRERLLALAARRADGIDECGWDQRLCFGDAEIIEFGEGVHESYAEASVQDGEELQLEEVGQWWCRGKRKCDRHAGWQKLRASDIAKEKDLKEEALAKFAAREQANRKRIENLLAPQSKPSPDLGAQISTSARTDAKPRTNGQASKRGKKRKAD